MSNAHTGEMGEIMQNKSYRKRFAALALAGLLAFGMPAEAMAAQPAATETEQPERQSAWKRQRA